MQKAKPKKTFVNSIKTRLEVTRILFSLFSMLLLTVYIVYMLLRQWGQSIYLYAIMVAIGIYIIISLAAIIIIKLSGKQIDRSIKNYKSGLKILKYILVLLNFVLTVSILSVSAANLRQTALQYWVLILSALWAAVQIIYQIKRISKRYRQKKKTKPQRVR